MVRTSARWARTTMVATRWPCRWASACRTDSGSPPSAVARTKVSPRSRTALAIAEKVEAIPCDSPAVSRMPTAPEDPEASERAARFGS